MGKISKELYEDWSGGVNTADELDAIPAAAYAVGRNLALTSVGPRKAALMKRLGMEVLNDTPQTGSTAIIGQHTFFRRTGSTLTANYLLVSDNGRLDKVNTSGTSTTISATAFTSSSSQEHLPDFADANNLCFIVNGVDQAKYNGTALQTFGIVAPSTAPTLADSGNPGLHDGTYEARVAYGNSATGAISSAGPTSSTVTLTTNTINWTSIPISADAQVDQRFLYIRNTSTQSNFYLVATIADNSSTTTTTNVSDTALTDIGPDEDENDPPPDGVNFIAFHRGRLFVADSVNLYYSKIDMPESYDPDAFEPVNPDDGQRITGIFSAFDVLVVLKSNAVYALVGDDPTTWTLRLIDPTVGCVAHRSVVFAGSSLYWWGEQGPVQWDGSGPPIWLGIQSIFRTIAPDQLSTVPTRVNKICAEEDPDNHRILFAVPQVGQTRNTLILPYNHLLGVWESDGWDPMDVASLGATPDSNGQTYLMLGNYAGQVFKWWLGATDGVPDGTTHTGTFVATGTSQSVFTGTGFHNTGGGLIERKVSVVDADGLLVDTSRPRISANTATSFTTAQAVTGLTGGQTYTFYIGGPALDFYSAWLHQGDPFLKKRYMFLYLQLRPTNTVTDVKVDTFVSYNLNPSTQRTQTFDLNVAGGVWDVSEWDAALWDAASSDAQRFRIGRTGTALLIRLRHYVPNSQLDLLKVAVISEGLSERIG